MNIKLKPIAESKVRQLGGDVCGVLVRTDDSEVMAVSEHGRCTRLDAGVMGPVDGAQGGQGAEVVALTGRIHELKTDPTVFSESMSGRKPWEIRKNDRDYRAGDTVVLRETTKTGAEIAAGAQLQFTGRTATGVISFVLDGPAYGLSDGWCIFSLYTQPQPAVPEESRPLQVNRYGVDRDYFTKKLEIIIRDMRDYTPSELARSLGRLAMTANSETMREPEFNIGDLVDQPKYRDSTPTTPQPAVEKLRCQQCGNMEPFHATGCETEYGKYTPTTPQADGWKIKFMQIMGEIYSDLDDEHEDPIPSDLWDLWRDLRAATQPPAGQNESKCCCGETEDAWRLCPEHGPAAGQEGPQC